MIASKIACNVECHSKIENLKILRQNIVKHCAIYYRWRPCGVTWDSSPLWAFRLGAGRDSVCR